MTFAKTLAIAAVAAAGFIGTTAVAQTPLATTRVASGLSYPTFVTHAPGDTSRLFILEKRGRIRILDLETGTVLPTFFLNIDPIVQGGTSTNDERGLLGLAFDPDFNKNGYFYVNYTANAGSGDTYVARYSVSEDDPNVADPSSALTIISFNQPFSNHNGGWIGFGPDGYLYIATGDGGSANDPGGRAQDITNQPLGKLLRIDVSASDASNPYAIPSDNPFVGLTGDDEIWAYGLRNPWRCSFDTETGELWIADVGQNAIEEINVQPAGSTGGENYGWRCKEGNNCTGLSGCTCSSSALVNPEHTYVHSASIGGFSITGGYTYRGCAIPNIQGLYFYADWVIPRIWSLRWNGSSASNVTNIYSQLSPSIEGFVVNQISSFGQDANGELYICDHGSNTAGAVYKIILDPDFEKSTDLTGEGLVDGADLGLLLAAWGDCGECFCAADFDGNGTVDGADLGVMLADWSGK